LRAKKFSPLWPPHFQKRFAGPDRRKGILSKKWPSMDKGREEVENWQK